MVKKPIQSFSSQKGGQSRQHLSSVKKFITNVSGGDHNSLILRLLSSNFCKELHSKVLVLENGENPSQFPLTQLVERILNKFSSSPKHERYGWLSMLVDVIPRNDVIKLNKHISSKKWQYAVEYYKKYGIGNHRYLQVLSRSHPKHAKTPEEIQHLYDFFEQDLISRISPNESVCCKTPLNNEKKEFPIRYLLYPSFSYCFNVYKKQFPTNKIHYSTFMRYRPKWIKSPKKKTDYCPICYEGQKITKQIQKNQVISTESKEAFQLYEEHKKFAHNRQTDLKSQISTLTSQKVVFVIDFKEKIKLGESEVVVSQNFYKSPIRSIFNIAMYFFQNNQICLQHYTYVSSCLLQDSKYVIDCFNLLFQREEFLSLNINDVAIWLDNGPHHFRTYELLSWVYNLQLTTFKKASLEYFCEYHGKNICDSHFSLISRYYKKNTSTIQSPIYSTSDFICLMNNSFSETNKFKNLNQSNKSNKSNNNNNNNNNSIIHTLIPIFIEYVQTTLQLPYKLLSPVNFFGKTICYSFTFDLSNNDDPILLGKIDSSSSNQYSHHFKQVVLDKDKLSRKLKTTPKTGYTVTTTDFQKNQQSIFHHLKSKKDQLDQITKQQSSSQSFVQKKRKRTTKVTHNATSIDNDDEEELILKNKKQKQQSSTQSSIQKKRKRTTKVTHNATSIDNNDEEELILNNKKQKQQSSTQNFLHNSSQNSSFDFVNDSSQDFSNDFVNDSSQNSSNDFVHNSSQDFPQNLLLNFFQNSSKESFLPVFQSTSSINSSLTKSPSTKSSSIKSSSIKSSSINSPLIKSSSTKSSSINSLSINSSLTKSSLIKSSSIKSSSTKSSSINSPLIKSFSTKSSSIKSSSIKSSSINSLSLTDFSSIKSSLIKSLLTKSSSIKSPLIKSSLTKSLSLTDLSSIKSSSIKSSLTKSLSLTDLSSIKLINSSLINFNQFNQSSQSFQLSQSSQSSQLFQDFNLQTSLQLWLQSQNHLLQKTFSSLKL